MEGTGRARPGVGLSPLFVDLYELTMAQAYVEERRAEERAAFSLFVRTLPPQRRFLIAAGLDTALACLESLRFEAEDIAYLGSLGTFSNAFLDWLERFRFSGDVYAVPEGTPCFAGEPLLEVEGPIAEAQIVETVLLNQLTYPTLVASKAIRSTIAAEGRPVIDFGTRRTHGADAALTAARSLYLAGFAATSNVEAESRFGIPVTGTMAHSYILTHDQELDAFRAFTRQFPETVLLVDTYDTLEGVRNVIALAHELGDDFRVRAIRLDSGDLGALATEARAMLDGAGLSRVEITASGGLDEYRIAELRAAGAPIDAFAVGTQVNVSRDEPSLDTVYKLVSYRGSGRYKRSPGKATLPHRKQVFRHFEDGVAAGDTLARWDEHLEGEPLLIPVMRGGERLDAGRADLEAARARVQAEVARLPSHLHTLTGEVPAYPVEISPVLTD